VHEHCKVGQPRGFYDSLERGECFQVKRLVVKPGERLSLPMHHHRSEHWNVMRGTALVTRGEERFLLAENQSTLIPLGVTHRFENAGKTPLEVIEVQPGGYLGEDDIVRFDDQYGRDQAGGEAGNAALRQAALRGRARGLVGGRSRCSGICSDIQRRRAITPGCLLSPGVFRQCATESASKSDNFIALRAYSHYAESATQARLRRKHKAL
jgi:mannose-6-phosphate isomerase-like protein (cupin superfamily)